MFKKLLLALVAFVMTMGFAFAQVDANRADQAALDGVKGIGPKTSKAIIDERKKGGEFKDWKDFETRVKGIGERNSTRLSQNGLTINGQSKPNAPAVSKDTRKDVRKDAKTDAKAVKDDAKAEAKAEKKEAKADAKAAKAEAKAEKKEAKAEAKATKEEAKAEAKAEKKEAKELQK